LSCFGFALCVVVNEGCRAEPDKSGYYKQRLCVSRAKELLKSLEPKLCVLIASAFQTFHVTGRGEAVKAYSRLRSWRIGSGLISKAA